MLLISLWFLFGVVVVSFLFGVFASSIYFFYGVKKVLGPLRYDTLCQWLRERAEMGR